MTDSTSEHEEFVSGKRRARMSEIDRLSPELRELVHKYGYTVVNNFIACGVTKPKHIRHLVERVLDEFSPTRGSYSKQGKRTEVVEPVGFSDRFGTRA